MTHAKLLLLQFMGGTDNVHKKKNSWIMFHVIPDGCKIIFNLENKNVFLKICFNEMA